MTPETAEPVDSVALTQRFARERRWQEIQPVRDAMMKECRLNGMTTEQAREWTYAELDRLYPPLGQPQPEPTNGDGDGDSNSSNVSDDPQSLARARVREGHLQGLDQIPADWPALPDNAALPVELSWVQAQRLRIVQELPSGATVVHLERAGTPAPSWAALGWLETSIRSYAKFVDICAKGLGQQELESDMVKRERRSIAEVRALLSEMRNK